jgi:predicted nuclease of predicted toxin-antitoxin system
MKWIIDANLSWRLVKFLERHQIEALHCGALALPTASDQTIWAFARNKGYVILTQDADFSDMVIHSENGPPIIWLRKGNMRTFEIESILDKNLDTILHHLGQGARLIELS